MVLKLSAISFGVPRNADTSRRSTRPSNPQLFHFARDRRDFGIPQHRDPLQFRKHLLHQSQSLALSRLLRIDTPVALPPGRLKLATA